MPNVRTTKVRAERGHGGGVYEFLVTVERSGMEALMRCVTLTTLNVANAWMLIGRWVYRQDWPPGHRVSDIQLQEYQHGNSTKGKD
jgi:hypothetical protein